MRPIRSSHRVRTSAATTSTDGSVARKPAVTIRSAAGCSASRATTPGLVHPDRALICLFNPFPGSTIGSKVKGLSSVTGRVGYAWDRFLGYVKGGGAWEQDEYTWISPGFTIGTVSQTRSGWTVGIGGEYAFTNNLSGFVEYDWYGFGTKSVSFFQGNGALWDIADIKENKSVLKIGLNWKFGKGPVVANY